MPLIDRILHPFKHGDHHDEHRAKRGHEDEILTEELSEKILPTPQLELGLAPPSTVVTEETREFVSDDHPVAVPLPGIEEPVIVKQVQGPEVEIHKTHIEQPIVHETHTHRDVVHEHHVNQEIVHERHIEQPIITEKHIERPVVHEKHIERPIIHEKHFEKDVIHEKHIEQPVIHEKHYEKPVVHEQHIIVPIIHEQHIVKPIIHEVHVTQVITDFVMPTQTTQEQLAAAISSATNVALGQAGVVVEAGKTDIVMEKAEVRVEQNVPLETVQNQTPPMVVQTFDHPMPTVVNADGSIAAAPLPMGASSTATMNLTQPFPYEALSTSSDGSSSLGETVATPVVQMEDDKHTSKKGKKRSGKRKFFFFRKH